MARYSQEELTTIASLVLPEVLRQLKAGAAVIDEVEVVSNPTGLTTLPAYDDRGGQKKVVRLDLNAVIQSTIGTAVDDAEDALLAMQQATSECEAATETCEGLNEDSQELVTILSNLANPMTEAEYEELGVYDEDIFYATYEE